MADEPVKVELAPRLDGKQLAWVAVALVVLAAALIVAGWVAASSLGLFSTSARGVNGTRVLGNTVTVWLSLTGVIVLLIGAFGALADLRKPEASAPAPVPDPNAPAQAQAVPVAAVGAAVGAVTEALGKAFASLKGSSALIVAGLVLMVTAGFVAWAAAPEAACETNLTTTQASGTDATTLTAYSCLLYTSPSPRDGLLSRMPSSA